MGKIIHIVFSESAGWSLKHAYRKKSIVCDEIIVLYDNISHGIKYLGHIKLDINNSIVLTRIKVIL
jgi:hypothetical protein